MLKRSSKKPKKKKDLNELAVHIVEQATKDNDEKNTEADEGKDPAAVALGRLSG